MQFPQLCPGRRRWRWYRTAASSPPSSLSVLIGQPPERWSLLDLLFTAIAFSPFLFIQSAPAFSAKVELSLTLRQQVLREAFGAVNKRKLEAFAEMIGQNRPQTIRPASQAKLLGIV